MMIYATAGATQVPRRPWKSSLPPITGTLAQRREAYLKKGKHVLGHCALNYRLYFGHQ
jgi:hypothetical protein